MLVPEILWLGDTVADGDCEGVSDEDCELDAEPDGEIVIDRVIFCEGVAVPLRLCVIVPLGF